MDFAGAAGAHRIDGVAGGVVPMQADGLRAAIVLPRAELGGVRTWAWRTGERLVTRGAQVMVIAHAGAAPPVPGGPRLELLDMAPPEDGDPGAQHAAAEAYARLLEDRWWGQGPIVLCPQLTGGCYAASLRAALAVARSVRLVGWLHSDFAYDYALLARFGPSIARFACVSGAVRDRLRRLMPDRSGDMDFVPHGVDAPHVPLPHDDPRRPLRLLYTGRFGLNDKRSGALPALSRVLDARGIAHELRLVGEGPATPALAGACAGLRSIRLCPPTDRVEAHLAWSDAFVLPSRREGAGLSLLEAMAFARPGVVAASALGAREMIEESGGGAIAEVGEHDDDESTAGALADAVKRLLGMGIGRAGAAARDWARRARSVSASVDATAATLIAAGGSRTVPRESDLPSDDRPWTVPQDAGERLALALRDAGPCALWGAGAHTRAALADLPAADRPALRCIVDDDPSRAGQSVDGIPIVTAGEAAGMGVGRVVISSWLHEGDMWSRRGELERWGLEVARLYPGAGDR